MTTTRFAAILAAKTRHSAFITEQRRRVGFANHKAVRAVLRALPQEVAGDVYVDVSHYNDHVEIRLVLNALEGLKDQRLLDVLEPFADWEASSTDYTYGGTPNRDFRFEKLFPTKDGGELGITLTVAAYVRSDSESCRIVERGFREVLTKEPIREIVCA